jgi:16S rRNA (uracil1498-N3)-methyltransferase
MPPRLNGLLQPLKNLCDGVLLFMPAERYYLDNIFKAHGQLELKGSEFHHLAHVMRTRKGDSVELVNGKGSLAQAIVQDLAKDKAMLKIEHVYQEPDPPCRLILAQALPKPNRLDFILEKGTELGVNKFWLFPGHYSAKRECSPSQWERAQMVTIAAMKQCGRLHLPSLHLQPTIDQWKNWTNATIFFGDLDPEAILFEAAWKNLYTPRSNGSLFEGENLIKECISHPSYPIIFITGPEGGFSQQEVQCLKDMGAQGVKLHNNILRTDTASLMALSLLSHWLLSLSSS